MDPSPEALRADLENRLRFEMLLAELSARFVSASADSMDGEIVNAQRQIVESLDLDRCTLAQLQSGERFVVTHSWQLPGLQPFPGFAVKDLPWLSSVIADGGTVCWAHIDDLPEEAGTREGDCAPVRASLERYFSLQGGWQGDWCNCFRHVDAGTGLAGRHCESPAPFY
ncbi:MAG: hypothetical protein WA655_16870 [Candidatus Korobacteraceae bacterium]